MKYIIISSKDYLIKVEFDDDVDIRDVIKFEADRLESLLSKKIDIGRDNRYWDKERKITLRIR